jgi:hypothetical protein
MREPIFAPDLLPPPEKHETLYAPAMYGIGFGPNMGFGPNGQVG